MTITITTVVGSATNKNCAKPISGAPGKVFFAICVKIKLGGVPISVAIPPIEAEKAIDRKSDFENGSTEAGSPVISSSLVTMASALGTIVRAVAVFDIHIDKKAVTIMIPHNKTRGFKPKIRTVLSAIRECRFHLTIAVEKIKPPRKTNEVSENIDEATAEAVETANNGSKNTGKNAVITIGIGSKIHHNAVIIVTPKHGEAFGFVLSSSTTLKRKNIAINTGPRNSNHQRTAFTFAFIKYRFFC